MADGITIKHQDFANIINVLDQLPDKLQKKTVERVMKKGVRKFTNQAKANLRAYGAQYNSLANAIGPIPTWKTRNPLVIIGIRAKGKWKYVGYIGHWVEYGVSGVKQKESSSVKWDGDDIFRFMNQDLERGEKYRIDIPPKPFMRPAADRTRNIVRSEVFAGLQTDVDKEVKKTLSKAKIRHWG